MSLQRFPGLIDAHVHLREPGATHKEDFYSGSRAAVAGGFAFIIDMPNNPTPTITADALAEKIELSKKAMCDIGFHFGTNGKNLEEFPKVWGNPRVFGLKIYCNHTTGEMLIEDKALLQKVFEAWESDKPILVHAEGEQLETALHLAKKFGRRLHVCHISQASEVALVRRAKEAGEPVTAGVCPHHLYFTKDSVFKTPGFGIMKPPLGTQADQDALWEGILDNTIDIVETDHAPHTIEEKTKTPPAFGVPGLETALGCLWKAVRDGRLDEGDVVNLLYNNPKKIFEVPELLETYVELDPEEPWTVGEGGYETKCGWSPFEGMTLYGKPKKVVIKGQVVLEDGKILEK
ncbi:MAG TPA: amidohydrolase family protein [Candidatus Paceibacterota bacterium]|jgi:dihydroorotase-like cyclic amidohydrolase|nr:amidohydrolase family protein [Candidatus Paceibacterota bacterium]